MFVQENFLYRCQIGNYPVNQVIMVQEPAGEDEDEGLSWPDLIAFVPDLEGDIVRISFLRDNEVTLCTKDLEYIMFDAKILRLVADLSDDAEELFETLQEYFDEETETYSGHEHLLFVSASIEKLDQSDS